MRIRLARRLFVLLRRARTHPGHPAPRSSWTRSRPGASSGAPTPRTRPRGGVPRAAGYGIDAGFLLL